MSTTSSTRPRGPTQCLFSTAMIKCQAISDHLEDFGHDWSGDYRSTSRPWQPAGRSLRQRCQEHSGLACQGSAELQFERHQFVLCNSSGRRSAGLRLGWHQFTKVYHSDVFRYHDSSCHSRPSRVHRASSRSLASHL